ncbi:aldehyde ferredoxin oxidoreductase family protein [Desulfobacula toluolica]|uniref:aldehyde ferredoxin oxidoreductase family protein n=1 Tax=Desulfobacula toluolica TaxID=28223 RepID=UPI00031AC2CC|nr:aldehyde ferredoxin oxidoreductase family protein [Desulfobacula toluolica]
MQGYNGKRLRIDLTGGKVTVEEISKEHLRKWLGGRGLNSELLYRETEPELDPFSPENRLIFGVGPLTGTFAPSSGRCTVTSKSPAQDPAGFGDANMGGHWGAELKYAGYDQLVIQGKADSPVYLYINNGRVEIRDAEHLWGKNIPETDTLIKNELQNHELHIALIGLAGENLVRYACIINDVYRAAGRCGMGAVMGSKNLKAIALRGTNPVEIARPREFFEICSRARKKMRQDAMVQMLNDQGTLLLTTPANHDQGWFCWKNFQKGHHPDADLLNGENHRDRFLAHREGCFACSIACGRFSRISKGEYAGEITGGPEYETVTAMGPRIGLLDPASVIHNNRLVNELGMDSCSCGGAISWAMECYEKGLLTKKETNGLTLRWGDQELIDKLVRMIASREGFGDILAEGAHHAAKKLDCGHEYTMSIKGHTMSQDDPRGLGFAFGIGFATGRRGGDHLQGLACLELTGAFYPGLVEKTLGDKAAEKPLSKVKKPEMEKYQEDLKAVGDCLTQCSFTHSWSFAVLPEHMAAMLSAATGMDFSPEELLQIGGRIVHLERAYWNRLLVGRLEDKNPRRFTEEPMPDGPNKGSLFPEAELIPLYYQVRGWDPETGFPTADVLNEYGLPDIADELEPYRIKYLEYV